MKGTTTYFKVGVFALSGVALFVAGIVLIGSGVFAERSISMETYFDESVAGLQVGAPIKYRGVQIGNVEEIDFCSAVYSEFAKQSESLQDSDRYVYVRIGLSPGVFGGRSPAYIKDRVHRMVTEEGMRVRLQSQGITGIVHLEADYPQGEASEPLTFKWTPNHQYVPSTKSTIARLSDSVVDVLADLREVPFAEIGGRLDGLLKTTEEQVSAIDFGRLNTEATEFLATSRQFITDVREILESAELKDAGPEFRQIISRLSSAADRLEPRLDELAATGQATLEGYREVAGDLRNFVQTLDQITTQGAPAAESVFRLAENVLRNLNRVTADARRYPSFLIFGEAPEPRKK